MSTATATKTVYTPDDLLAVHDSKGYELVDGQLVEKKMGIESGRVGTRLIYLLERFCDEREGRRAGRFDPFGSPPR